MIHEIWLPQALSIGVDYDTFWRLSPKMLEPFVTAFRQRAEREAEQFREHTNFAAWLQGIYFARAIAANFSKNARYYDRPIDLDPPEDKSMDEAAKKFEAFTIAFNQQFGKEEAI